MASKLAGYTRGIWRFSEGVVNGSERRVMNVACGSRQILIHGLMFVFVGLVWGLVVPHTPYPRLALGAHIQFEGSGVLFIVVAILLLKLPHRVGSKSIVVILIAVWLTWLMALSEVGN